MNKAVKIVIMAVLTLSVLGLGQTASAWWGHAYPAYWGGPVWGARPYYYGAYPAYGYDYGYSYGYGYDACCAPIAEPCCAPAPVAPVAECATCEPVCDTCGPVYGGSYVLGWRPGPIRRLLFGRYRWYSTGYYGGYTYYAPDCCGAVESYDSVPATPATPVQSAPAVPQNQGPSDSAPSVVTPDSTTTSVLNNTPFRNTSFGKSEAVPENSGIVTIYVPQDAVVYVNDAVTSTTGSARSFVSFGLTAGNEYDYVVRAEVTRDGQKHVETRVVTLKAGDQTAVSFAFQDVIASSDEVVSL